MATPPYIRRLIGHRPSNFRRVLHYRVCPTRGVLCSSSVTERARGLAFPGDRQTSLPGCAHTVGGFSMLRRRPYGGRLWCIGYSSIWRSQVATTGRRPRKSRGSMADAENIRASQPATLGLTRSPYWRRIPGRWAFNILGGLLIGFVAITNPAGGRLGVRAARGLSC